MKFTMEFAEILGIHVGDGYMRVRGGHHELDISGNLEEKEFYDKHVIKLLKKEFSLEYLNGIEFQPRNTYGIKLYKKHICKRFIDLGIPIGKKGDNLCIPTQILGDSKLIRRFLRGFFDTDGNIYFAKRASGDYTKFHKTRHYHPRISLDTTSRKLFEDLKKALDSLNINYSTYIRRVKNEGWKDNFSIRINGKIQLMKWISMIGIKNPVKRTRYEIWNKFGFCPPHTTLKQREKILIGRIDPNSFYKDP